MGEMKPTKGAAYNKREGYSTVYVFVPIGRGLVQEVAACGPTENGQEEQQANADLITEAFNVHHNTGLSPVQLVEMVKELGGVLQAAVDCGMVPKSSANDGGASKYSTQVHVADRIRAALAKCEGVGNE